MKTTTTLLLTVTFIVSAFQKTNATIRTVCNYPVNVAQYNTLQSGIDASSSGDTVLVQGSPVTYDNTIIQDKRLTLIGPGWSPIRNVSLLTANVTRITINGANSSGTEIQGFVFTQGSYDGIIIEEAVSINNLRIIRNHFAGFYLGIGDGFGGGNNTGIIDFGYVIEGNYFESTQIFTGNYLQFQNSVIQNNLFYNSYISNFILCNNVVLNHNFFYNTNLSPAFSACSLLLIENNIFSKAEPGGTNVTSNCAFKNNITYNTSVTPPWTINGNGDDGGNILGQNPGMVDQAAVNSGTDNPLLNFTIPSGPANNSASDGKDMGLLYDATGSLNWNNSRNSRIPYIFSINIANNTIQPDGTLNVSIEARKQN